MRLILKIKNQLNLLQRWVLQVVRTLQMDPTQNPQRQMRQQLAKLVAPATKFLAKLH